MLSVSVHGLDDLYHRYVAAVPDLQTTKIKIMQWNSVSDCRELADIISNMIVWFAIFTDFKYSTFSAQLAELFV